MTRVWRCNGWATSRQRSFEMKRQSVFLQRRVEDGWSVGWIFEVFRRSMKCSPSAHHFKRLPQICFRCQWLWHLPPRTACWAANLWEILWDYGDNFIRKRGQTLRKGILFVDLSWIWKVVKYDSKPDWDLVWSFRMMILLEIVKWPQPSEELGPWLMWLSCDIKHVDQLAGLRWCWWVGTLTKRFFTVFFEVFDLDVWWC